MRVFSSAHEILPAAGREVGDAADPVRVELGALVLLEEVLAGDAVGFGEAEQPALVADQALVDVVELLDQRVDAVLVERQRFDRRDDLVLELLVAALLGGRERRVLQLELDVLVLQAAELLVEVGDAVEGLDHLRLELGLHRGERQGVLVIVLVVLLGGDAGALGLDLVDLLAVGGGERRRRLARRRRPGAARLRLAVARGRLPLCRAAASGAVGAGCAVGRRRRRDGVLGVGAGIGRLEVDDVAEENLAGVELVAPDDDRLEGERRFAEARDHGLAAGLDALGDGDLALAARGARPSPSRGDTCGPDRRCGRSARAAGLVATAVGAGLGELAALGLVLGDGSSASSASSVSMTLMPMSLSMA